MRTATLMYCSLLTLSLAAQPSVTLSGSPSSPTSASHAQKSNLPVGRRLKDIAQLAGINHHSLTGYGLVAGLANSGDSQSALSSPLVVNLLTQLGMQLNPVLTNGLNRNVAVVAVTAELPPFSRSGDRMDVRVSSLGDAKDLQGGTLLNCLLRGPDGNIYASAQGPVSSLAPSTPSQGSKPAVIGLAVQAATVSSNLESQALSRAKIYWQLFQPDLTTATRVSSRLQSHGMACRVVGPGQVELDLTGCADPMATLARAGETLIDCDQAARIICDERTATVVAGAQAQLSPVVISHRGVTLQVGPEGSTLGAVVESLQKAGATPKDILGIVEALHRAGALTGELIIR